MSFSNCMSIVNDMEQGDQDALMAYLAFHQAAGVDPKLAQRLAVEDAIRGIERDTITQGEMFADDIATKLSTIEYTREINSRGDTQTLERGNLNSAGQKITGTKQGMKNFWNWFGESEAAENGKPLVLYHSTNADIGTLKTGVDTINNYGLLGNVSTTRSGIFATPSAKFSQGYLKEGGGQNVMPVYMSLQEPFDTRNGLSGYLATRLDNAGILTRYRDTRNDWALYDNNDDGSNPFVDKLKEMGFDGAIFYENDENGDEFETYMAFESSQVKSALGNLGTFSEADDRLSYSSREEIRAGADAIKAMTEDQRDNLEPAKAPGGWHAYVLYEARKLLPKPSDKLKKLTERNSFIAHQDNEYLANVDGVYYGVNKWEDPDATGREEEGSEPFVYAFNTLEDGGYSVINSMLSDVPELMAAMRANNQKLQLSERVQTETPQFKKWFGDSKVVDTKGRPLVVYHGSPFGQISEFDKSELSNDSGAFFFSSDEGVAEGFSNGQFSDSDGTTPGVTSAYLSLQNPAKFFGRIEDEVTIDQFFEQVGARASDVPEELSGYVGQDTHAAWVWYTTEASVFERLKELGFDGFSSMEKGSQVFAAFEPTQIKSAIGNNGDFDGTNPDINYSERAPAQLFFSELARQVQTSSMNQAPAGAWKSFIKALSQKGVKADEVEWTGVNEWLDLQEGKVPRAALVEYLGANGVQVEDVVLSGAGLNGPQVDALLDDWAEDNTGPTARAIERGESWGYIRALAKREGGVDEVIAILDRHKDNDKAKYKNYTLPGGENYREVLLKLPTKELGAPLSVRQMGDKWYVFRGEEQLETPFGKERYARDAMQDELDGYKQFKAKSAYRTNHWEQENVLAHLRLNDRKDSDGKRVLFVEEVQSDWGQDGKKRGFANRYKRSDLSLVNETESMWAIGAKEGDGYQEFNILKSKAATAEAAMDYIVREKSYGGTVPRAPLVEKTDAWLTLSLKRVVGMAVDGGYDKVAFVTGAQSAERYSLSKQVDELVWFPDGSGRGDLQAFKGGAELVFKKDISPGELPDLIGKEAADRLLNRPTEKTPGRNGENHTLSGLDLKVGGDGMIAFYDKIVPNAVNALLKKVGGGKLTTANILIPGAKVEAGGMRTGAKRLDQPAFDITDAMREKVAGGMPMFSERVQTSIRNGTSAWDGPEVTRFDDMVYKMQDKMIDVKRVIESITKSVGQIADDVNVYLQEELFHGRAAKRTTDFGQQELQPLMEQIKRDGYTIGDVEEYLHARHAKEANAVIASREASMPDGGSGMLDADAAAYLAGLSPRDAQKLNDIATQVDAILGKTRQMYADYGLESQQTVDGWEQMFQHYVPLQREDKEGSMGIGQGFSVKGKEVKGRTGSTRKVVDIIANIAMQRERLIVRGEKNRVSQALVGLAMANPNPDFWTVGSPPRERVYDPKTNTVVERMDPMYKSRDNVLVAKMRGANGTVEEVAVNFNEDDPRALRMAKSMKNMDAAQLEGWLGVSAKITRYFSAINTQYNPIFGVVNLMRDVQGALINLDNTPLASKKGRIARDTISALSGIYQDMRAARQNRNPSSSWSALWDEFQQEGGQTGFRQMFETSKDRADDLQSILTPYGWMDNKWGKFFTAGGALKVPLQVAQDGAAGLFNWLSDYNESMENSVRLAAYKAAKDQGMSREQAASLAKNLTVNFNRKGQVGQQAGAVYAFFNAAMQGTARIGQTLFTMDGGNLRSIRLSGTGKKVVYGGMLLGSLQALALAAAGFDDEDPPDFVRERSLIIPTGGKTYVSIPMPLGFNVIPGLGRMLTEFALSGFKDPAKRAIDVASMFAGAFNPIGNAGMSIQTIAPTAIDPLVALTENRDYTGKPIARTSSNQALPGHSQYKDTASTIGKLLAEGINWSTGGNAYVAGALSPTPDQIDYLIGQGTGGVGREILKIQQTSLAAVRGEDIPTYKIPLLGRFIGDAASQASQGGQFYGNVNRLNELETEVKGMRKDGKVKEAAALLKSRPDAYLIQQANVAERQLQRLRREKRALIDQGASREAVKAKELQATQVMTRLNLAAEKIRATE